MMRRVMFPMSLVGVLLVSMVAVGGRVPGAVAQNGTPPPGGFEIAPGVTAEILPTSEDPPSLYRLHFAPDVTYPIGASPSLEVVYIESGALTLRVEAPVTVGQVGVTDAAGENVAAGTEFTVEPGNYFVLPPFVGGEVRNDGQETATVSVAGILPDAMATPTAGTPAA